jgi:photosystem II Psb27 protein
MIIKSYFAKVIALFLVIVIGLFGFSGTSLALSGDYKEDTLMVIQDLTTAIELPSDATIEAKRDVQANARQQINDYISRYRKNGKYNGLKSFTTMQTALNSLAGFYTSYGSRPLPEQLRKRLTQEFKQVEFALNKGY